MLLFLLGCPWIGDGVYDERVRDQDGDGGLSERFGGPDCVDDDPTIATCDADRDGFRTVAAGGTDCDDANASVHPDAQEVCNGGAEVDEDCDGLVGDADPDVIGQQTWYLDGDGDGVGGEVTVVSCAQPDGYVPTAGDCNDADPEVSPAELERCDNVDHDCDGDPRAGATNPIDWYLDDDGDSFGGALSGTSCEPPNPTDVDNDQDCDDSDPAATTPQVFYADADGDGFGLDGLFQQACTRPEGYATEGGDCDDSSDVRYPFALEICDGIDNDCDLLIDDDDTNAFGAPTWYADADGDGFTVTVDFVVQCVPPAGYTTQSPLADCNDTDAAINPNQVERCDDTATDDDCDGLVNEEDPDYDGSTWYYDGDQDGFGTGSGVVACEQPFGYAGAEGDCNDSDPAINPQTTWYVDGDGDGYGDPQSSTVACNPPGGYALEPTDCDDSQALVNPGQAETCGAFDEDCDGLFDDDDPSLSNGLAHRFDADGDGSPGNGGVVFFCGTADPGYVPATRDEDCDDDDPSRSPLAAEVYYDGIDTNCDPTDEFDADGDGYACSPIVDAACPADGDDCDDSRATVHPGADEVWYDASDDDCDGNRYDADGDGFVARTGAARIDDDGDDDGLHDQLELNLYGTDPALADSDGGGEIDGDEIAAGRDPNDPLDDQGDPQDADGDGLSDADELVWLTDPDDPDSDDDGLLDGYEVHDLLTDPLEAQTDCNDGDALQYPQAFDLTLLGASRLGAAPPPGCAVGLGTQLQDLVDCNCESGVLLERGSYPAGVTLAGTSLYLFYDGTDPNEVEALFNAPAVTCAAIVGPADVACLGTSFEVGDPGGSVFTVTSAPSPDFPERTIAGRLVLDGVVVTGGIGSIGAGVTVEEGGQLDVVRSAFVDNFAYLRGGAIAVEGGTANVATSSIAGNLSLGEGAGISVVEGDLTVLESSLFFNQGTQSGAIDVEQGRLTVAGTRLTNNALPQIRVQHGPGAGHVDDVIVVGPRDQGLSDVAQIEVRQGGIGPIDMSDVSITGGDRYLDARSPTTLDRFVLSGTLFPDAVLATDTLLVMRRGLVSVPADGVTFDSASGTVQQVGFRCGAVPCEPFLTSNGNGTLFGPQVVDNLFQAPPGSVAVQGNPVYLGPPGGTPLDCDDPTCSSTEGNRTLTTGFDLVRFHPDLDPLVWDVHARPGSPLIVAGPDVGVHADHAAYHQDTDGDGLPDGWEEDALGSTSPVPAGDPDGDGLTNLQEYQAGTHPLLADSDSDGIDDDLETSTHPLDPDTDDDGALDGSDAAPLDPNVQ